MCKTMKTLDETIRELEELKKQWSDKYQELVKYVEECNSHANSDTPDEIEDKLKNFGIDLRTFGQDYRDKIKETIDNIAKEHINDSIVKSLATGIVSDIDNSGGAFGSREDRLRYLSSVIDIINKQT